MEGDETVAREKRDIVLLQEITVRRWMLQQVRRLTTISLHELDIELRAAELVARREYFLQKENKDTMSNTVTNQQEISNPILTPKPEERCYFCIRPFFCFSHQWTALESTKTFLRDLRAFIPSMAEQCLPMVRLAKEQESNGRSNQWSCLDESVRLVIIVLCVDNTNGFFSRVYNQNTGTGYKDVEVDIEVKRTS